MIEREVIIVGGGPAGAACASGLGKLGIPSLILEKEHLPRVKLCAGWITPSVMRNLEIDPSDYPSGLVTFNGIEVEYFGRRRVRKVHLNTTQHSIRRSEFDAWLVRRSGAELTRHEVKEIHQDGDRFVIDDQLRCKYLVGAGGTFCPVYRTLFKDLNPRSREYQVGALEEEFAYDTRDERCHLWFAERGLVGYAWYMPKGNGWLNVGLGGFSSYLRRSRLSLHNHWDLLVRKLGDLGLVRGHRFRPRGHTYFIRQPTKWVQRGNAYIVGDSAGLATRDLAEGIGPGVESGLRAAGSIATGVDYSLHGMTCYSAFGPGFRTAFMERVLDQRGLFFVDRVYARSWRAKEERSHDLQGQGLT